MFMFNLLISVYNFVVAQNQTFFSSIILALLSNGFRIISHIPTTVGGALLAS